MSYRLVVLLWCSALYESDCIYRVRGSSSCDNLAPCGYKGPPSCPTLILHSTLFFLSIQNAVVRKCMTRALLPKKHQIFLMSSGFSPQNVTQVYV